MTMREIWEAVKDFFRRDWTPAEKVLVILCCILFGVIKGFCLAPIKRGIKCGCNKEKGSRTQSRRHSLWKNRRRYSSETMAFSS